MRGIFQGFSIEASAAIGAYECELSLWGVVQKGLSGRDAARAPWKNTMARRDMSFLRRSEARRLKKKWISARL